MKKLILILLAFVILFSFSSRPTHAIQITSGDDLTLAAQGGYKGNQAVFGKTLTINSKINGDLICAGQVVVINAEVTGDVLCAAQFFTLSAKVGGDVRVAGQAIILNGEVVKNVNVFAESLTLGSKANIRGELDYASKTTLSSDPAAKTAMVTKLNPDEPQQSAKTKTKSKEVTNGFFRVGKIVSHIMTIILGLALVALFPNWIKKNREVLAKFPTYSFLWGLIIVAFTPIIIILLFISILGIPLALLLIPLFIFAITLAHIVVAAWLGNRILPKAKPIWSWLAGYLLLALVGWLPIIGWFVGLIATFFGLGAIKYGFFYHKKK